ncbi:MAG TPA: hypothetical protein VH234_05795 [Candidatus Saccharimonadales bacterium]|nr:hypothetical protein [Candidatus Saccharimonadales bacterium]
MGLDLPIFPAETRVANKDDLHIAAFDEFIAQTNGSTFVRGIGITAISRHTSIYNLMDLLKKTDKELNLVAELCQAIVVNHQWGLYPVNEFPFDRYRYYRTPNLRTGADLILPKGYILAAEVNLVLEAVWIDAHHDSTAYDQKQGGLSKYYKEGEFQLYDMRRPGQMVTGMYTESPVTPPAPVSSCIVDIEPRLGTTYLNY